MTPVRHWIFAASCAVVTLISNSAFAADRWEEAAGGAVAILPKPSEAKLLSGGSLYCSEQKWGFLFRTETQIADFTGSVKIGLEGQTYDLAATQSSGVIQAAMPVEMLDPLKAGTRLRVDVGANASAIFNLRGSTAVIEAIAPRCSQIDMTGYQAVTLLESGPAVDAARTLFADEIRIYRGATGRELTISATQIDRTDNKRLLFGQACGAVSYYGASGCTTWGWAATGVSADWRPVYATEGVRLYLDEKNSKDGWPGLATLPVVNGTEAMHWFWSGDVYAVEGQEVATEYVIKDSEEY